MATEISLSSSYESFRVDTQDVVYDIYPNATTNLGFLLNYRFLSLGFKITPNFLPGNDDEEQRGDTQSFELGGNFILTHWLLGVNYARVKGYYLKNSNDFPSWESGDPYFQFPNLKYSGVRLSVGYSSNENFSFSSLFTQTERQLHNAGSFVPYTEFRLYTIDDTSGTAGTQKSKNTEIIIGPGYAYSFVVDKTFFVTGAGKFGAGYHHTRLTTRTSSSDIITKQENFLMRWEGALGLGYNGDRFYTGVFGILDGGSYDQEGTTARNTDARLYYRAFVGYRFNAPKFLKKSVDGVEKLIPFNKK